MTTYRIKNWSKFQHFKDRKPIWIKLYRDILDQRDIMTISAESFRFLICLWLLASEDDDSLGTLPAVSDIAWRLKVTESKACELLRQLDTFLISDRYQDDMLEKRREETKTEIETEIDARVSEHRNYGELQKVRLTDEEYAKLQKDHTPEQLAAAIEKLDGYIAANGKKYKNHYAVMKAGSGVWENGSRANNKPLASREPEWKATL